MISAHEPPELPPIVARPSGSLVSFTLHSFSTSGSTSVSTNSAYLPDMVSYSSPRWLPWASPLPLRNRDGDHRRHLVFGDEVIERLEQIADRAPSAPTMNGAAVPGTYCFGT